MITSMHIENFKCFKNFDIDLDDFNVLIGPNDSGKTAFLEAVRVMGSLASRPETPVEAEDLEHNTGIRLGRDCVWRLDTKAVVAIKTRSEEKPGTEKPEPFFMVLSGSIINADPGVRFFSYVGTDLGNRLSRQDALEWLKQHIGSVRYHQFKPSCLRRPVALSHDLDPDGLGLPAFLARLSLNHPEGRDALQNAFRERFPFYTGVKIIPKKDGSNDVVHLRFQTAQGEELPATSVSDGVMVSLGFLALAHDPESPGVLLVEEPENHVHHASLKDIIGTLKELSNDMGVQVVLTSHSPYLLDEVGPEEVYVFDKDVEGAVHAARMSDHPEVEGLRRHFGTGEIWTGFESDKAIVEKTGEFE
ncbi:MAG TPA: AAA family ATPase [Phycisphaerae bacterium]|nr:AAA family ATPase [Phycisphaerae bacterium]